MEVNRREIMELHELNRCIGCNLKVNSPCDILFGDPWGVEPEDADKGYTVMLAKTEKGKNLLEDAVKDGVIALEPLDAGRLIEGQYMDHYKKVFFSNYLVAHKKGWLLPYCNEYTTKKNILYYSVAHRLAYAHQCAKVRNENELSVLAARRKKEIRRDVRFKKLCYYGCRMK